ncbi:MAG: c-type cytochrome [Campylobacterales bacterium]|nr:c-type cytochrome [Campylobacterales bacterium]
MKEAIRLVVASVATITLITGCGDTYDSEEEANYQSALNTNLGSLQREVNYLIDAQSSLSLYTFDDDFLNVTNCDATCQQTWPIFTGSNTESTNIQVFDTNTSHLAYRQHSMYFFNGDSVEGDVNGDNVKNVWHLIYAPAGTNDSQTEFSQASNSMTQTYLTGVNSMTLYVYDKDDINVSNCDGTPDAMPLGSCEARWPVFYTEDLSNLPKGLDAADFGTIDRDLTKTLKDANGDPIATKQTTYKGQPLYYWFQDAKAGDATGDWVAGVWHVVELEAQKTSTVETSPYTAAAAALGEVIFTDPNKCASCHGTDGQTPPLGVDNVIAKYGDAALIDQKLKDMRDNGNPNNRHPAMVSIAQGLSDEAIINLSAFIATLKK